MARHPLSLSALLSPILACIGQLLDLLVDLGMYWIDLLDLFVFGFFGVYIFVIESRVSFGQMC
jgi:hypothetical protein